MRDLLVSRLSCKHSPCSTPSIATDDGAIGSMGTISCLKLCMPNNGILPIRMTAKIVFRI